MKDEVYVGNLVSLDEIRHSAKGSHWKEHKYIKKIGDRYYYTQKELVKATKKAGKAIGKAASDAQFELEWQAGRAADAVTKGFKDVSGLTAREDWLGSERDARNHQEISDDYRKVANEDLKTALTTTDKKERDDNFDYFRYDRKEMRYWADRADRDRKTAEYKKDKYNRTAAGRIEGAADAISGGAKTLKDKGVKTLSGLYERRKKLKKKKK